MAGYLSFDADDAGLADHGRAVARLGGDDAFALVLDDVVAQVPGTDVGVAVVPRLRQRVAFEAARHPRLVARLPPFGGRPLLLLQHRLLTGRQFLSPFNQSTQLDSYQLTIGYEFVNRSRWFI